IGFQQRAQAAELAQQMARQVHRALAGHPGTQEYRQQFGVGKRERALFEKLFPRPFCHRPVTNAHVSSLSSRPYFHMGAVLSYRPFFDGGRPRPEPVLTRNKAGLCSGFIVNASSWASAAASPRTRVPSWFAGSATKVRKSGW